MPTVQQLLSLVERFDWAAWAARSQTILDQHERNVVRLAGDHAFDRFTFDDPFVQEFMTGYVGERIVDLDATTRDEVANVIRRTMAEADDLSTFDVGTAISDAVAEKFDGYSRWRADRIARTETAIAYNHGTVLGLKQSGATRVVVSDGDDDDECASVDGQIWSIEDALANPVAHPNCTRAFAPILEDEE